MQNRNIEAAWKYHDSTKHSWHSVSHSTHYLDWNNQPIPFKVYPHLEGQRLPTDLLSSGMPALSAIATQADKVDGPPVVPTRRDLAALIYYAAGITKKGTIPGGYMYFRAAACTGALYHIELYLVCGDLPDLSAGVYHCSIHDFSLRRLREGDHRQVLVEASGGEPSVAKAPAVIVCTSVYWRNSWKYQARAYRHSYWDSGTILANLLAMGAAQQIPLNVVASFVDSPVNRLLDLDDQREVALQLVPVGRSGSPSSFPPPEVAPLGLETVSYSRREVDYPAIREMHAASSLLSPQEAHDLWGDAPQLPCREPQGQLFPLAALSGNEVPPDTIEEVVLRRGSSRRFRRAPITYGQLSTMLDRATRGVNADFFSKSPLTPLYEREDGRISLNQLYLIVNAVDGLPSGSYVFHRDGATLEQLKVGDFREKAGYLGLQQGLPADASVDVFFLTDLAAVLDRYGNRGYRMAQMEASIMGGRLYLAAYAHRLGATGLTFFDDDVTEFFSPHAAGKSVMFLVALGVPQRRRRNPGRIL
jgi:SagB-type dehydrogenase family enzyme